MNTDLLKFEVKKLSGQRYFIVFLVICLIINGIIAYLSADKVPEAPYLKQMLQDHAIDARPFIEAQEEMQSIERDYNRMLFAYMKGETAEEPQLKYPCHYSGLEELDDDTLLRRMFKCIDRGEEYKKQLEQFIEQAQINKEELLYSYSGIDTSSFAYKQQDLIERRYTQVLEQAEIFPELGLGWNQLFAYNAVNLWMILAVIAGAISLVLSEAGNASMILRCAKKGRLRTAAAKTAALLCWSLLVLLAFTSTTMLAISLKSGGFSSPANSIAIFEEYTAIPLALSIGEFFALLLGTRFLSLCVVGIVCACLSLCLRTVSLSMAAAIAATASQYMMFLLGKAEGVKYLNLIGAMSLSTMLSTFRCIRVFENAVEFLPLVLIFGAAITIIGAALFLCLFCNIRLGIARRAPLAQIRQTLEKQKTKLAGKLPSRKHSKRRHVYSTGLFAYEWRKVFTSRSILLLLLLTAICKISLAYEQYNTLNSYGLTLYTQYIDVVQGEQTDEKRQFIEDETKRINTVLGEFPLIKQNYRAGKISYDNYRVLLEEYNIADSSQDVAERVLLHSQYIDALAEHRGVEAHYLYDIDWLRLFDAGADILLIALLAFISAGVFSDEYTKLSGEGNRMPVISATKKGRTDLYRQKLSFALLLALIITLLFNALDGFFIARNFKLPSGGSPLLSLEIFGNAEYSGSIDQFIALNWVIQLFAALITAGIVTLLGALIKNKLYTLLASFSLLFAPLIFKKIGLPQFAHFDISNGFDAGQLWILASRQDVLGDRMYILTYLTALAVIFAALLLITYRKTRTNKS